MHPAISILPLVCCGAYRSKEIMNYFIVLAFFATFANAQDLLKNRENVLNKDLSPFDSLKESRYHNLFPGTEELLIPRGIKGNALSCGFKYFTQVFSVSKDLIATAMEGKDAIFHFLDSFHACRQDGSVGIVLCVSQGIRDAWEQNEQLRDKLLVQSLKVMNLFENIYGCLFPLLFF